MRTHLLVLCAFTSTFSEHALLSPPFNARRADVNLACTHVTLQVTYNLQVTMLTTGSKMITFAANPPTPLVAKFLERPARLEA